MIYKFYDTCSLLLNTNHLFDNPNERTVISSITLQELEDIKTSSHKDLSTKFLARQLMRALNEHKGEYDLHIYRPIMLDKLCKYTEFFEVNNDLKILATAFDYDYYKHPDETVFVTNDLVLKNIANLFFGEDSIISVQEEQE
jgi:predicted ribonuclease YlaK